MERIASKMEIKIDKIQEQLYKDCNDSKNNNWKNDFISQLDNIKIRIHQCEVNPSYILKKEEGKCVKPKKKNLKKR